MEEKRIIQKNYKNHPQLKFFIEDNRNVVNQAKEEFVKKTNRSKNTRI